MSYIYEVVIFRNQCFNEVMLLINIVLMSKFVYILSMCLKTILKYYIYSGVLTYFIGVMFQSSQLYQVFWNCFIIAPCNIFIYLFNYSINFFIFISIFMCNVFIIIPKNLVMCLRNVVAYSALNYQLIHHPATITGIPQSPYMKNDYKGDKRKYSTERKVLKNKWIDKTTIANNFNIEKKILNSLLEIKENLMSKNESIKIILKCKFSGIPNSLSLSFMQTTDISTMEELEKNFVLYWRIRNQYYQTKSVESITFTYTVVPLTKSFLSDDANMFDNQTNEDIFKKQRGYNLPIGDYKKWGSLVSANEALNLKVYYDIITEMFYYVFDNNNTIRVECRTHDLSKIVKNGLVLEFSDTKVNNSLFLREYASYKIYHDNKNILLTTVDLKTKFIKPLKVTKQNKFKIITMDIETYIKDKIMIPYCVSIHTEGLTKTFYKDSEDADVITLALEYLVNPKFNNHFVYMHNLSKFDINFMLGKISNIMDKIEPTIKDGNFINLAVSKNGVKLNFRDSMLILPASLKNLALSFLNKQEKMIFPHDFVNDSNLKYIGATPDIKYFTSKGSLLEDGTKKPSITPEQYKEYFRDTWNLMETAISYCENDVKILYDILNVYNTEIYDKFAINLSKTSTISSLAFKIFRTHYLKNTQIPILAGSEYQDIKRSYTGGSTDVFIKEGSDIYCYDVNSLYPFVMKKYPMPVGTPTYFVGDISLINKNPYGIFNVNVKAPYDIKNPILQISPNMNKEISGTISPVGTWKGMYTSIEIENAKKFGYSFEIISGYIFSEGDVFSEYVTDIYDIKCNSSKATPMYTISKQLLNSQYGRFGMNPVSSVHLIVNSDDKIFDNHRINIKNITKLSNTQLQIEYQYKIPRYDSKINISIAIASMITSTARVHMSQYKNIEDIKLYYTDTDSIFIDTELSEEYVNNSLGSMKLEYIMKDAIFLAPKMYAGITTDGKEIVKTAGLDNVSYDKIKKVYQLKDNEIVTYQERWRKDIENDTIVSFVECFKTSGLDNKRISIASRIVTYSHIMENNIQMK